MLACAHKVFFGDEIIRPLIGILLGIEQGITYGTVLRYHDGMI